MSEWIYYLVQPFTGTVIEEMPLTAFSYQMQLDNAGGFNFEIPIRHAKASAELLAPGRTLVYAENGGRVQFGGMMWVAEAAPGGVVRCGGQGLWSLAREGRRRIVSRDGMTHATGYTVDEIAWEQVDQLLVAKDIIDHYNQALATVDFGEVVLHGPEDDGLSGILIDRYLWTFESPGVAESVEDLTNTLPGFDFSMSHEWTEDNTIANFTHLWYPRIGTRLGLVLEHGKNFNLTSFQKDASTLATGVLATGAGSGDNLLQVLVQDDSLAWPVGRYPHILQTESYRDVDDEMILGILAERALGQLNEPMQKIQGEIVPGVDTVVGTFNPGDSVYIEAHDGWVDVSDWYRLENVSIQVDSNGKETITISAMTEAASLGIFG